MRIIGGGASCVLMAALEEIRAGRVFDCAGLIADPGKSTNPLIRSLLATGRGRIGFTSTSPPMAH
ncbi:MAG: hypothetical protein EOQ42_35510 [Mesorhizobium sp.]|nr:MAG: hypothetical protein EOQ42_35510 [Mesorhizobium sp.]